MSAQETPAAALRRQLIALGGQQGIITDHREKGWASITFAGTRHRIDMVFLGAAEAEAGERLIEELPEHLFDVPRHIIADAAVIEVDQRMEPRRLAVCIEFLLLEDF